MKHKIIEALQQYIDTLPKGSLKEAVSYALLAGGKRLRPLLMLSLLESYNIDSNAYASVAISLEMLHTYSLIHDDLPAMDNDTLRRGQPTLHIAFDEGIAILAGDTLLTDSFHVIASNNTLSAHQKQKLIEILSSKAGSNGMILGQVLDLESEGKNITLDMLNQMYVLKTAYLLQASLMFGAVIANEKDLPIWEKIGYDLGLLFQIQDDVLEETSTVEKMGKSKTDTIREKPTYVSLLGLEKSLNMIELLSKTIQQLLEQIGLKDSKIASIIDTIIKRDV
jgi:geranylgeranyl diphosphate synthase type II